MIVLAVPESGLPHRDVYRHPGSTARHADNFQAVALPSQCNGAEFHVALDMIWLFCVPFGKIRGEIYQDCMHIGMHTCIHYKHARIHAYYIITYICIIDTYGEMSF